MSKRRRDKNWSGFEFDGNDLFFVHNGERIAKRGEPGTRHARTWISLEPGFTVIDSPDLKSLIVQYSEGAVQ